jgi:hypothetical protein
MRQFSPEYPLCARARQDRHREDADQVDARHGSGGGELAECPGRHIGGFRQHLELLALRADPDDSQRRGTGDELGSLGLPPSQPFNVAMPRRVSDPDLLTGQHRTDEVVPARIRVGRRPVVMTGLHLPTNPRVAVEVTCRAGTFSVITKTESRNEVYARQRDPGTRDLERIRPYERIEVVISRAPEPGEPRPANR